MAQPMEIIVKFESESKELLERLVKALEELNKNPDNKALTEAVAEAVTRMK